MKALSLFLLLLFGAQTSGAQEFRSYVHRHFEVGYGAHLLLLVPGFHPKVRYAPLNYSRVKLFGEVRGEMVTAPIIGWNYNIQLGSSLQNTWGFHAGFGRSQYISGIRKDSTESYNRLAHNTVEFGATWRTRKGQRYDIFASVPMYFQEFPILIVGITWNFGGIWDYKEQRTK